MWSNCRCGDSGVYLHARFNTAFERVIALGDSVALPHNEFQSWPKFGNNSTLSILIPIFKGEMWHPGVQKITVVSNSYHTLLKYGRELWIEV